MGTKSNYYDGIRTHSMRRSAVHQMRDAGLPIQFQQALTGHVNPNNLYGYGDTITLTQMISTSKLLSGSPLTRTTSTSAQEEVNASNVTIDVSKLGPKLGPLLQEMLKLFK